MPAKKLITKQVILDEAFQLVRKCGMDGLNARELAKRCGCSTQPIYLSFKGIDEIKSEVAKRAVEQFYAFIEREIGKNEYPEYKAVGMGYIKFAIEETELFKYLFMRKRVEEDGFEKDSFDKSTFIIMKNYGLYTDQAYTLHTEMWVFVHGIATMFATGYLDWEWETVSKMVSDVYLGLLAKVKQGENK